MKTIKLAEWCEKTGVKYLTAWRWFKNDAMPVYAYQTETGTILVEDDSLPMEQTMINNSNDAMSLFLKKTVEFSKNSASVEDFAAYVISNFSLKLNSISDTPKYSKQKPKSEEIQKHFQKFLPGKEEQEHFKSVKNLIKDKGVDQIVAPLDPNLVECINNSNIIDSSDLCLYGSDKITESLGKGNVDFNTTPQTINYTDSTSQTFSNNLNETSFPTINNITSSISIDAVDIVGEFQPTEKELQSSVNITENVSSRGKRGRRPSRKK